MKSTKLISLLVLHFAGVLSLPAQHKHDNNWLFSDHNESSMLTFIEDSVELIDINIPIDFERSSAAISDESGDLAFYTNGCFVLDRRGRIMLGGEQINPGSLWDERCAGGLSRPRATYPITSQSHVIIPKPHYEDQYFLLHKALEYRDMPDGSFSQDYSRSYVSTIDMTENGGYGAVIADTLFDTTNVAGRMALNRHANGEDW